LSLEGRKSSQIHDPGAEFLDRMTGFWDRFGRIALMALGGLVVVAGIVFVTMRARARSEDQAAGQLAQANVLYWQGEYARSLEMAQGVAQQFPSTSSGIDAHRLSGDNAFWTGDFKTAITEYRTYLDKRKDGVLADAARRSLAYALESDRQFAEAAAIYDELVGTFDRESSAEFLNAAARCYRMLGQEDQAIERLERLVKDYGASSYATIAQIQLSELRALGG